MQKCSPSCEYRIKEIEEGKREQLEQIEKGIYVSFNIPTNHQNSFFLESALFIILILNYKYYISQKS